MSNVLGTSFATHGFTWDPNISPNNQSFLLAVQAVTKRLGLGTGGGGGTNTGSVTSVAGTSIGTGSAALVITGSPITTSGTLTFALAVFDGTNAGVVPASAGGITNFLRADGSFAVPGGTNTGSVTKVIQGTGIIVTVGTLTATGTVSVDATWSPTWTGNHTFQPASGTPVTITGNNTGSYSLDARGASSVGTSVGNQTLIARLFSPNGNADGIILSQTRVSTGTDWHTAGPRLQQLVDSTWMGWIQFSNGTSGNTNNSGISFGAGSDATSPVNVKERMRLTSAGDLILNAPDSGTALTVTGADGTTAVSVVGTGSHNDIQTVSLRREAPYNVGTAGFVNSALRVVTNVTGSATSYEWTSLAIMNNSSPNGQNVAHYAQGNRQVANAGPTWGAVHEVREVVAVNDPTTGLVGLEVDNRSNGSDLNNNRIGIHVVCSQYNTATNATVVGYGIKVEPVDTKTTINTALSVAGTGTVGFGLDMAQALNITSAAIRIPASKPIIMDGTGNLTRFYYDTVGFRFDYNNGTLLARVNTSGAMILGNPTGGDEGAGTINITGNYYINGVALPTGALVKSLDFVSYAQAGGI